MNRTLIIIRGLPGSGKSTFAKMMSNGHSVFSIDDYFTNEKGEYHFIHTENHKAYKQCEENVRVAMKDGEEKIFLDNVFSLAWEIEPYFKMASEFNYTVHVVTVEKYHDGKNIHQISEKQIAKMGEKYQVKLY